LFKSSNDVIQYSGNGRILRKGTIKISSTGLGFNGTIAPAHEGYVSFTIEVSIKAGKYKIKITKLYHTSTFYTKYGYASGGSFYNEKPDCGGMKMTKKQWATIKKTTDIKIKLFLSSFKDEVENTLSDNNSDW